MLSAGLLALLTILLVSLVWLPLRDDLQRAHQQVIRQSQDLEWLQQQASRIRQIDSGALRRASASQLPLLTLIDKAATDLKIRSQVKQIQPGTDGSAVVWFDRVLFEDWLKWTDRLSGYGVVIVRASVTPSISEPMVNVRMELASARQP
jgi:type II secretory pathway component PulM